MPYYQTASGQPLADVVVGLAFQLHRQPARGKSAEALACRTGKSQSDRSIGEPGVAVAARDLAGQRRANRAVAVRNCESRLHPLGMVERWLRELDQGAVQPSFIL